MCLFPPVRACGVCAIAIGTAVAAARRLALPVLQLVALLVVFAIPTAAHGQVQRQVIDSTAAQGTITLAGTVRDSAGRGLDGAEVRAGPSHSTITDARGHFVLSGVPFDTVQLVARRIGFEPASVTVAVTGPGLRVELAVTLMPNAVQLGTIVVEGKTYEKPLWDAGYYRRERLGRGKFFGPEFLDTFGGADLGSLLRVVPRVMVDRVNNESYAYGPAAGARCRMNIFLDGQFAQYAMPGGSGDRGVSLSGVIGREDIYAVEVYAAMMSVPTEFVRVGPGTQAGGRPAVRIPSPGMRAPSRVGADGDNQDAACGAIVIWTKPFAAKQQAAAAGTP